MVISQTIKNSLCKKELIEILDLSEQGLGDDDVKELVELICKNEVTINYLNLYRNNITDEGASHLASLTTIKRINLCYNNIGDNGAKSLFRSKIYDIDLSDNALSNESVNFFLKHGQQTSLNVYQNGKIDGNKFEAIEVKLKQNLNLQKKSQSSYASISIFDNNTLSHSRLKQEPESIEVSIKGINTLLSKKDAESLVIDVLSLLLQSKEKNSFVEELQNILSGGNQLISK